MMSKVITAPTAVFQPWAVHCGRTALRAARQQICARAAPTTERSNSSGKVSFISLGCPKNVVDGTTILIAIEPSSAVYRYSAASSSPTRQAEGSYQWQEIEDGRFSIISVMRNMINAGEVMLGDLARHGFTVTEEAEDADCIVVNTCAFVEDAKTESLEV